RAIKFMIPSALGNAEAVERFLREARATARLKSEHVAKVHDVGRLENGAPYMVMEYLEGSDLNVLSKRQEPLPAGMVALFVIQACQALAEAHAAGIVHRDLKPANLFLTTRPDGSPCIKVLDFGISKVLGATTPGAEFEATKTHEVLGSPYYMSPEQLRSAKSVDPRTDIWSLGVILYRLISGTPPFRGENLTELITTILSSTPPPISQLRPGVPPDLDRVILGGCLRHNREERYPNVAALAAALAPFAAEGAGTAVESANRLVGTVVPATRPPLHSVIGVASANIAPSPASIQPAERTANAWGQTAPLGGPRGRLLLVVALAISALSLIGAIVFVLQRQTTTGAPAKEPGTPPIESAAGAEATASAAVSTAPGPSAAPVEVPAPEPVVAPLPSAAPSASAVVSPVPVVPRVVATPSPPAPPVKTSAAALPAVPPKKPSKPRDAFDK
ncbi:MAG: serine/threonine-protein kinase, partial [Minicystis sp.]